VLHLRAIIGGRGNLPVEGGVGTLSAPSFCDLPD